MSPEADDELPAAGSSLGAAVQTLRTAHDVSIHQLAETTGLAVHELQDIEAGQHEPAVNTIREIADALDSDVATVFTLASSSGLTGEARSAGSHDAHDDGNRGAPRPTSRRQAHYRQARANAEITLRDPALAQQLAAGAREQAGEADAARLGDVHEDLRALIRLLEAFADGRFRAASWENLVLATAALRYFVSPEDIVPDYLDAGYIDDGAIIAFVSEMIAADLDTFLDWENHD